MDHISAHIQGLAPKRVATSKNRDTERGDLMLAFMTRLNQARVRDGLGKLTMPRMGKILEAIPTKDLYYLKTVCEKSKDFSKKFWWEINPKNHTPEAKAKAAKKWEERKLEEKRQKYRQAYNDLY
jgi:hypothetical protein